MLVCSFKSLVDSVMFSWNLRRNVFNGKFSQNSFLEGLEGSERDLRLFDGRKIALDWIVAAPGLSSILKRLQVIRAS